jgi:hypothetical protein
MTDLLGMDRINSLPQPFTAHFYGGGVWPVIDIDVLHGFLRIDVVGLLEVKHISDVHTFIDANGESHDADSFYADFEVEAQNPEAKP